MEEKNNYDEIDLMLFDYFNTHKEVPNSTQNMVNNIFKETKPKPKHNLYYQIKKVAILIISLGIATTSVVFAKDIINFIGSLFNNSTEAIDTAVENGYVQNIDMDFVYDNNIGIKAESVLLDKNSLDISFLYHYVNDKNIYDIQLIDYVIKDEKFNIIYNSNMNDSNKSLVVSSLIRDKNSTKIDNFIYRDSILYKSYSFPKIQKLFLEISKIRIDLTPNDYYIHSGTWNFEIKLIDQFSERNTIKYNVSYNKNVYSSLVELNETCLTINLELSSLINKESLYDQNKIILTDSANQAYRYKSINIDNKNNHTIIILEYDISKFKYSNLYHFELNCNDNNKIRLDFKEE